VPCGVMDDEFVAMMARRRLASDPKPASEAGAAPASDEAGATENRTIPASQDVNLERGQQRLAAVGAASGGQTPPSARAAPASDEAGVRANRAKLSSQAGPDDELRLKFEKRQQRQARAAAGTGGGAQPGPAAAGAIKGPEPAPHEDGAREVSGIGASAETFTGAGAKAPKEIVRRKGGIGDGRHPLAAEADSAQPQSLAAQILRAPPLPAPQTKEIVPVSPSSEEGSDATRGADGLGGGAEGGSTGGTRELAGEEEGEVVRRVDPSDDGEEEGFVKVESEEDAVLVSCPQPMHPRLLTDQAFYSCRALPVSASPWCKPLSGSVNSLGSLPQPSGGRHT